jgi:hypothetical protein
MKNKLKITLIGSVLWIASCKDMPLNTSEKNILNKEVKDNSSLNFLKREIIHEIENLREKNKINLSEDLINFINEDLTSEIKSAKNSQSLKKLLESLNGDLYGENHIKNNAYSALKLLLKDEKENNYINRITQLYNKTYPNDPIRK